LRPALDHETIAQMARVILTVLIASAVGSLIPTLVISFYLGGFAAFSPIGIILLFWMATTLFTVAGAILLVGLRRSWRSERFQDDMTTSW
jgi:predicted membrane protein